jgi:putative flippase GtrA
MGPAQRFAIVGVGNFVVSFAVFYLSYRYLPFGAAATNVLAYAAGMLHSFVWNRSWTFRAGGNAGVQAVRFVIVNLACLAFGTILVYVLVDVLRYPPLLVWVPVTAVSVVLSYLGCKHWAFAAPALRPQASA